MAYLGEEVIEPQKTIPRAMLLGTASFIALYVIVNLAYLYILPIAQLGAVPDDRVASTMVARVLGPWGAQLVAALIILSTFDTVNSSVLTNARVYFAMARDRVFWKRGEEVHPKFQTPYVALICQGVWSVLLLCSGSFELIADMYVFVNWVLYVLMAVGVFILRRRHPNQERPFKIPGYPWIPLTFTVFATIYVILTLVMDIQAYNAGKQAVINSAMGLALVASGLPFYLYWKSRYRVLPTHAATAT